ncbi:hypothetical protein J21TS7_24020 [Paenibacillus cineris]|uniref:Uncharacterized protein n=1 Tax=Paenibacillus cineris TaxID=237530 RepID=A0ABQ4LBY7_9BACL|nr:hypothetical protein J21TS7_24020 [Paenibacillus cineris]
MKGKYKEGSYYKADYVKVIRLYKLQRLCVEGAGSTYADEFAGALWLRIDLSIFVPGNACSASSR